MTTYDANGIPHYQETDLATQPGFSDLLNLLADATSVSVNDIKATLSTVQGTLAQRNVWNTVGAGNSFQGIALGTGGTVAHRWRILDGIFEAHFEVTLGSVNWAFNDPSYILPIGWKQAPILSSVIGQGAMEDVSAGVPGRIQSLTPLGSPGLTTVLLRYSAGATQSQAPITNTAPFTWGAGDRIRGYIRVPVVPV